MRGIGTVEHLVEHLRPVLRPSTAIVCVGNELAGDDAAGVMIARRLQDAMPWSVYDAQTVPESFLMKIVDRRPETVILVDALHFGGEPGAVELVEAGRVGGQGPSTHGPAPVAFLEVLQLFHACGCWVLGIEPSNVEYGAELCEEVRAAVDRVVEAFRRLAAEPRRAAAD